MSTALILSGGGARAAYQVGVLRTVSEIVDVERINPFPVISGSSAGAINAALLACESHHFGDSVRQLETLWTNLKSESVHGIGTGAVFMSLWRLFRSMLQEGYSAQKTWSLLDNSPLRALLGRAVDFGKLRERLERGDLEALAISALAYRAGISLSFFEARHDVEDWDRHRRVGKSASLTLDHLMASAAIPGIYPAVRIGNEYYGDGAIRQSAPLSPALHLGARKLFVIGVSHNPKEAAPETGVPGGDSPPSLAHMTSHFLNGPFIDALEEDLENVTRLNEVIEHLELEERERLNLAVVDVMSISPSKRIDDMAADHIASLPSSMRFLMKILGATRAGGGASLASYLMFESPFLRELIECGYDDAIARRDDIERFLS